MLQDSVLHFLFLLFETPNSCLHSFLIEMPARKLPLCNDCDVIVVTPPPSSSATSSLGVVEVFVELRGTRTFRLDFDFSRSNNLALHCDATTEQVSSMRCRATVLPGFPRKVCSLAIENNLSSTTAAQYSVEYEVSVSVKSPQGTFVPLGEVPLEGKDGFRDTSKPLIPIDVQRSGLTPTLDVLLGDCGKDGFTLSLENRGQEVVSVLFDFSASHNLFVSQVGEKCSTPSEMVIGVESRPRARVSSPFPVLFVCDLMLQDPTLAACSLHYKVMTRTLNVEPLLDDSDAISQPEPTQDVKEVPCDALLLCADSEEQATAKEFVGLLPALYDKVLGVQESERFYRIQVERKWREAMSALWLKWGSSVCALCRGVIFDNQSASAHGPDSLWRIHAACAAKTPTCSYCRKMIVGDYVSWAEEDGDTKEFPLHKECSRKYFGLE